jgi:hypothetical protein
MSHKEYPKYGGLERNFKDPNKSAKLTTEIAELREQLRLRDEMLAAVTEIDFSDGSWMVLQLNDKWSTNFTDKEFNSPIEAYAANEAYAAIKEIEKQNAVE